MIFVETIVPICEGDELLIDYGHSTDSLYWRQRPELSAKPYGDLGDDMGNILHRELYKLAVSYGLPLPDFSRSRSQVADNPAAPIHACAVLAFVGSMHGCLRMFQELPRPLAEY